MEVNFTLSEKARQDLYLVELAKTGNERAFASLLNRYRDAIYYLLLKMVNNPIDAEDLTMEAFGKAFRNIDSYTPNYAFSTWLFKIATNNCIDFIRKSRSQPSSVDHSEDHYDSVTVNLQSDIPDPEEIMINEQKILHLRGVVNQLKPRYKMLIELRYFKEYSYEEIATEMKIPVGTVKAQLYRAKSLLANIMLKTGRE